MFIKKSIIKSALGRTSMVLRVEGIVNDYTIEHLQKEILDSIEIASKLIIDFSKLEYIDSESSKIIMQIHNHNSRLFHEISFRNVPDEFKQYLNTDKNMGFKRFYPFQQKKKSQII